MDNVKCAECGALQGKKDIKAGICWQCKTEYDTEPLSKNSSKDKKNIIYPKCPNVKCDNHLGHTPPKEAFVINVIEKGMMGKIFKAETVNMVSCKQCGHIIGVSGQG